MSDKIQDIINKWRNSQADVKFEEVRKVLEHLGYRLSRSKGSHRTFIKHGHKSATIPFAKPIRKCYIKMVLSIYDEENLEI